MHAQRFRRPLLWMFGLVFATAVVGAGAAISSADPTTPSVVIMSTTNSTPVYGQSTSITALVNPNLPLPTGTVTFTDGPGGPSLGTIPLNANRKATLNIKTLSAGAHTVVANYSGDGFYFPSSNSIGITVSPANTSTAISGDSTAVYGQTYKVVGTVSQLSPSTLKPNGTADLYESGNPIVLDAPVVNGKVVFNLTGVVGSYSYSIQFDANTSYNGSTSGSFPVTVSKADSKTTTSSNRNPSIDGESVTITAKTTAVAPGAGARTGSMDFSIDGGGPITVPLDGFGNAAITTSSLTPGTHFIYETYSGDANFNPSGNVQVQTVKYDTDTTVTSNQDPSYNGEGVTFNATVVSNGGPTPTGSVQFKVNGVDSGSPVALSGGTATSASIVLATGTHSITAHYLSDSVSGSSVSDPYLQTVYPSTSTSVVSSSNPSVSGESGVSFTATVSFNAPDAGTPTGTVQFKIDGVDFGAPVALSGGQATSGSTSFLAAGSPYLIEAEYDSGTVTVGNSTGSDSQIVNPAQTSTALGSSVNPSVYGESVTFTATVSVTAPGTGTPTTPDTVTFYVDGFPVDTVALNGSSQADYVTSGLPVGTSEVAAVYNGGTEFLGSISNSVFQTVNQASTTTSISFDANPSVFGQDVNVTATVAAVPPGGGTPNNGSVTFKRGSTTVGTVNVVSGQASISLGTAMTVGSRTITATYNGSPEYAGSLDTATHTVNKAATSTAVVSDNNPSTFGSPVTFTATVSVVPPGAASVSGLTVTFKDGATTLGTGVTNGSGQAQLVTSALTIGAHNITAVLTTNSQLAASTSPILVQTVT